MNARAACGVGASLLLSAACVTSSSPGGHRVTLQPPPVPPAGREAMDASYDWHGLILVPFGTLLKDSPVPLHEVLLFHDEGAQRSVANGDAAGAGNGSGGASGGANGRAGLAGTDINKDCYTIDGTPPRFAGHRPDRYLLCFDHDRLNRLEASVSLAAEEAPSMFARACAQWLKNTAPAAVSGHACEGRDGNVAFSARLALAPGAADAMWSMTLSGAGKGEAPHAP